MNIAHTCAIHSSRKHMTEWEFQEVLHMTSGRTLSPVARFRSNLTAAYQDMIVKSVGPHLVETSLFCELFGNVVAREMGLNTPEPHLLDLDQQSVGAMNADAAIRAAGVTIKEGIAIGSDWLRPAVTPAMTQTLSQHQAEQAARIYAYDLMLQNPDRLVTNPNVLEFRGQFIAIDFETSCSFLFAIPSDSEPWNVSKLPFAQHHFFRSRLSQTTVDWQELTMAMLRFEPAVLESWTRTMPSTWHDDCERVIQHLLALKEHGAELGWELLRALS